MENGDGDDSNKANDDEIEKDQGIDSNTAQDQDMVYKSQWTFSRSESKIVSIQQKTPAISKTK
eukprot:scaffold345_cov134-Cylindrotheca_fusiformis.AAC.78